MNSIIINNRIYYMTQSKYFKFIFRDFSFFKYSNCIINILKSLPIHSNFISYRLFTGIHLNGVRVNEVSKFNASLKSSIECVSIRKGRRGQSQVHFYKVQLHTYNRHFFFQLLSRYFWIMF